MIVADTSFWINHWRLADLEFSRKLLDGEVLMHPFVIGELALGSLRNRRQTLVDLHLMQILHPASHDEVLQFIESKVLYNRGIGYTDTHLLAACLISGHCKLLTRDRRLREAAEQLGIAA